ncbi:MAG: hypothetical protein M1824_005507 [Vezdaea acicularis]|nr:MAG: hypothetical protein M1824_005507 [Vezdaea acicularis]
MAASNKEYTVAGALPHDEVELERPDPSSPSAPSKKRTAEAAGIHDEAEAGRYSPRLRKTETENDLENVAGEQVEDSKPAPQPYLSNHAEHDLTAPDEAENRNISDSDSLFNEKSSDHNNASFVVNDSFSDLGSVFDEDVDLTGSTNTTVETVAPEDKNVEGELDNGPILDSNHEFETFVPEGAENVLSEELPYLNNSDDLLEYLEQELGSASTFGLADHFDRPNLEQPVAESAINGTNPAQATLFESNTNDLGDFNNNWQEPHAHGAFPDLDLPSLNYFNDDMALGADVINQQEGNFEEAGDGLHEFVDPIDEFVNYETDPPLPNDTPFASQVGESNASALVDQQPLLAEYTASASTQGGNNNFVGNTGMSRGPMRFTDQADISSLVLPPAGSGNDVTQFSQYQIARNPRCATEQSQYDIAHLPNILYTFRQDNSSPFENLGQEIQTRDVHGKTLRDFEFLPDSISTKCESWRIEYWRRLDRRLAIRDILQRMWALPAMPKHSSWISTPCQRFRDAMNVLAWTDKGHNENRESSIERIRKLIAAKRSELRNQTPPILLNDANSTRGVTPGLIDPALGEHPYNRVGLPQRLQEKYNSDFNNYVARLARPDGAQPAISQLIQPPAAAFQHPAMQTSAPLDVDQQGHSGRGKRKRAAPGDVTEASATGTGSASNHDSAQRPKRVRFSETAYNGNQSITNRNSADRHDSNGLPADRDIDLSDDPDIPTMEDVQLPSGECIKIRISPNSDRPNEVAIETRKYQLTLADMWDWENCTQHRGYRVPLEGCPDLAVDNEMIYDQEGICWGRWDQQFILRKLKEMDRIGYQTTSLDQRFGVVGTVNARCRAGLRPPRWTLFSGESGDVTTAPPTEQDEMFAEYRALSGQYSRDALASMYPDQLGQTGSQGHQTLS